MKSALLTLLAVLSVGCATSVDLIPDRMRVMQPGEEEGLLHLCSRPGPPPFEGTWIPAAETIETMEARFGRLLRVKCESCCIRGERIRGINSYFRQYFGLLINGRRLIYINGILNYSYFSSGETEVADLCDGGTNAWGVLYDPVSGRFFDLTINGEA